MDREHQICHILNNANMQPSEEEELLRELVSIVWDRDEDKWLDKMENERFERKRDREWLQCVCLWWNETDSHTGGLLKLPLRANVVI